MHIHTCNMTMLYIGVLMRRDNSRATRTRLGQNSTRNGNEWSQATRNLTRKAREKLENFLYIKF